MLTADQMPILQPIPVSKRGERRKWLVTEDWYCNCLGESFTYIIPAGFIFDGASIPRLFWNILSPSGYLFMAGLVHDFVYKYGFLYTYTALENFDGGEKTVIKEWYTQKESDQKFEELADRICVGAHLFTRASYIALRAFGYVAWNDHRGKATICITHPKGYVSFGLKRTA